MSPKEKLAFEAGKIEGIRIGHTQHARLRNDALEEAARAVEKHFNNNHLAITVARSIRTLKGKTK